MHWHKLALELKAFPGSSHSLIDVVQPREPPLSPSPRNKIGEVPLTSGKDGLAALVQLSAAQALVAARGKTCEKAPLVSVKGRMNERSCIFVVKEWIRRRYLQKDKLKMKIIDKG